jgi:SAM-dependent methyltransferase
MNEIQKDQEIPVKEQVKKFAIKSMYGFQTVMTFGLGKHLGIFNYLYEKAKENTGRISSISFTIEELSENLNLNLKYLDGWFHMALECGIFEIEEYDKRIAKTAPHVYDLLINPKSMVYIGSMIKGFYNTTLVQELLFDNFKTGKIESFSDFPGEFYKEGQQMSAGIGKFVENLFSKYCKQNKRNLQRNGTALEIGCGYGLNLENWATKYKRAHFVGIDIDPLGISHAKNLIEQNNWNDRVEVLTIPLEDYMDKTDIKFDIIILNQVLHEMDPDENYRRNAFKNIYTLLKDDGLFIVAESMIPDTFAPNQRNQLFNVMHKWLEVPFWSRFYDEKTFKDFIDSTPFSSAELIKEGENYFWAIRK